MRILLYVYTILLAIKGITGANHCATHMEVIDVCVNNTVNNKRSGINGTYVNTGKAPKLTANMCQCTITPASTPIVLRIQGTSILGKFDKFTFKIKNVTISNATSLGKVSTVEIEKETSFVYSSSDTLVGGICLSIAPGPDNGVFSMNCLPSRVETTITEESTTINDISTATTSEQKGLSSESQTTETQTKPSNKTNAKSEINFTLFAIIAGSVGGVAVIAVVIIAIVCCVRKRNKETPDHNERANDDEDAYGMQDNPAYGQFGDVVAPMAIEDHYTEPDFTNKDLNSDYDYASHAAPKNKVSSQKTQRHEDDTYDHTVTSISGNMTGNDYNHLPLSQHGNAGDDDDYNVLNHK